MKQDAPQGFLVSMNKMSDLFKKSAKKKKETNGLSLGAATTRAGTKSLSHVEEPGAGKHSDKWDSCVADVKKKGSADNAYAVCTAQLGPSIEGGPGSGPRPHGSVGDAVDEYNARIKAKRAAKHESARGTMAFRGRFKETTESVAGPEGRRFRVTLLQEGMGNLGDCYYYTAEAIASAVPIFEGKKFFLNHPGQTEERDRPERDVRDIAGYFENCAAGVDAEGRANLEGDLVILNGPSFDRERTLIMESLSYSLKHQDEDLVGLSINASGDFSEVGIEAFMKEQNVPEPCQAKLMEALAQGITMMRPVRVIFSAVSCDLVTTAGAGGSINKLLEGEKEVAKQKEEPKKEEAKKEAEPDAGAGAAHADADQDKDLIMTMLKKHLGDGFSDEDKSMAKEAYENALAMHSEDGMEKEEAHKCAMETAGAHMKMARYMQKKEKAGDPSSDASASAAHKPPGQFEPDADKKEKGVATDFGVKESADGKRVIQLTAENAKLKSDLEAIQLEKHIDAKLRESRLPMSATKRLREAVKGVKTQKEFDEKLTIFKEAFEAGSGEADGLGFVLGAEKGAGTTGSTQGFGDCVDN